MRHDFAPFSRVPAPLSHPLVPSRWARHASALVIGAALALTFAACGNDGGAAGGNLAAGSTGNVTLALSEQPANGVASFTVEVTRFALRRTSGELVELVDVPTQVDLATSGGTARLLGTRAIPSGTYARGVVEFDVSDADLRRAGDTGATLVTNLSDGVSSTSSELVVAFEDPIVVSPTNPVLIELELDLGASLFAPSASGPAAFEPALVVRVDPNAPRSQVVVGSITSVDVAGGTVLVQLRGEGGSNAGAITLRANSTAPFSIDGVPRVGADALSVLAPASAGAPVRAVGIWNATRREFEVSSADVGSGAAVATSLPAAPTLVTLPCVEGVVVARTGGPGASALLEVFGRAVAADGTNLLTGTSFVVRTSADDTKVARVGATANTDVDALVVGQRVRAHGLLSGTILDATGTRNVVVLESTTLLGRVVTSTGDDRLVLDLERVESSSPADLSYADGDATPPDVDALRVVLPSAVTLATGTRVLVRGFAAELGDSTADFRATSVQPVDSALALAWVRNQLPFGIALDVELDGGALRLDVAGATGPGEAVALVRGPLAPVELPLAPAPTWVHPTDGGAFTLRDRSARSLRVFTSFAELAAALDAVTNQGARVVQIAVRGRYERVTNSFDGAGGSVVID